MKLVIFDDNHVKHMPNFMSDLQWMCHWNTSLSLFPLLFSSETQSFLSDADRVLFFVGTNSVRCFSAATIISQIEETIFFLQQCFRQLNQPNSIMIPLTFPCLKFCRSFPTNGSLISNIESYNHQLRQLSFRGTFTIIDCRIQDQHLAHDRIHLFVDVYRRLFDFIIDYLNSPKEQIN